MTIDVDSSDFDDKKRGDEKNGSNGRYFVGTASLVKRIWNYDRSKKKGRRIDQGSSQNVTELSVLDIGKIQESLWKGGQMVSRVDRRWGSWEVPG